MGIPTFRQYAKYVFKKTLISNVSGIVSTKSIKKALWKSLVFVACIIGFFYQTGDFLSLYFTYPTIVNVEESNPFEVVLPAITICSNNRFSRQVSCEKHGNWCTFYENDDFCETYSRFCNPPNNYYKKIPQNIFKQFEEYNKSWSVADELFPKQPIIRECRMGTSIKNYECNGLSHTNQQMKIPFLSVDNKPSYCYVIASQLHQPDSQEEIYPNSLYYDIKLNTYAEDYFFIDSPVVLYIAVHNRKDLVNPFKKGVTLKGGHGYRAFVSMAEVERLPYPYSTNCTDYIKLWRENGGKGPLTQVECIEYCKLNFIKSIGKCVDEHISYSHVEELCATGHETVTYDIIKDCFKQCQPACVENSYEVTYEELELDSQNCTLKMEGCRLQEVHIKFSFRQFQLTRQVFQPKFDSIEVFSYVGGYMGIWLGISLVSIFDVLESIMMLLCFWIRTKKRRKKLNIKYA